MPEFTINGIKLRVPDSHLTDKLREALESGRYENTEIRATGLHLRPGDRVLELGAGAGYVTTRIAQTVGAANVLTVEANPGMIEVIAGNLRRNGVGEVTLIEGAVVPDGFAGDSVSFHVAAGFWAAGVARTGKQKLSAVSVAALPFGELMSRQRPDVVVMDIEGAEEALFDHPWPEHVRVLILEMHPQKYPDETVRRIFDCMSASGLAYCANGSRAAVVVFRRLRL